MKGHPPLLDVRCIVSLHYVLSIDYSAKNSVNFWLIDAFLAKRFLTTCPQSVHFLLVNHNTPRVLSSIVAHSDESEAPAATPPSSS